MKLITKIITVLLLSSFLFACESEPSEKEQQLQATIDSLKIVNNQGQKSLNEYVKAINEIQAGLDEIKEKEKILSNRAVGDNEIKEEDVMSINNDIEAIYGLMVENRKKLNYLKKRLKNSSIASKEFKVTVENLTTKLNEKDASIRQLQELLQQKEIDIKQLNEHLNKMAVDIDALEQETQDKSDIIELQKDEMNTAFFIVDEKSALKAKGILSREGGFIGIGGVQKIKQKESEFVRIDIREKTVIDLQEMSKAVVITDHPKDSYTIQENEDGKLVLLNIDDPGKFWSMSKYLVISIR
ncbi:MAG: hypothetical protein U9N85_04060 [Bacteroidota bacterium]|nr:hypothetical protein [Bacteroidota bacterium]